MNKLQIDALLDLLFFCIEQKRCTEGARSHYKKGTDKYKWFDNFAKQYEGAEITIREYLTRKLDFEVIYGIYRKRRKDNNEI